MIQLIPSRLVLHCGLHKTGSTYIQRNLQTHRELLLEHGVLYLGPKTFKKRCSELWRHLQWGRWDRKTSKSLTSQTRTTLLELAGDHPESIHKKSQLFLLSLSKMLLLITTLQQW